MPGLLKNENKIFEVSSNEDFTSLALEIFRFQAENNEVYKRWLGHLNTNVHSVNRIEEIPFLPIEFFKSHDIVSGHNKTDATVFTSSATTSQIPSRHIVTDLKLYEESFLRGFRLFYGDPAEYCILALLPGYLERQGSSLVYMCKKLIELSGDDGSGFYLKNLGTLREVINLQNSKQKKTLLIGVSYALLDLADTGVQLGKNFIVMETGGMKGTRKEMLKPQLHGILKSGFGISSVHSEYGMTELLSQAYSSAEGLFSFPPWMRFFIREVDDPLKLRSDNRTGGVNVIDLANINSCAFIATKDLGRIHPNGRLELMGRYDNSDVRGCNLMLS